jgi:hypothetical protein
MEITTSSNTFSLSFNRPWYSVWEGRSEIFFDENNFWIIEKALPPLILITPIAPTPGGVAKATMVSSQPITFESISKDKPLPIFDP